MDRRKRPVLALCLLAAGAGVLIVTLARRSSTVPALKLEAPVPVATGESRGDGPAARAPSPPEREQARDVEVAIDAVDVDKTAVCKGEEAVVTIRARPLRRGGAPYMAYGVVGDPRVVGPRFSLRPEQSIGYKWMRVFVRGKNGALALADVPPIRVEDCEAPHRLTIDLQRRAAATNRAWLTVHLASATGAGAFVPVAYDWRFDDGTTATTTTPEVEHSYEGRPQDKSFTYYFVTVTARDAAGRTVNGSRSIRFANLGFTLLAAEAKVTVFSGIDDRVAGEEKISLYHGHAGTVRFTRAIVRDVVRDTAGSPTVIAERGHDPATLLGFSELPAGTPRTVRDLADLRPSDPSVERTIEIEGVTADGRAAGGGVMLLARGRRWRKRDRISNRMNNPRRSRRPVVIATPSRRKPRSKKLPAIALAGALAFSAVLAPTPARAEPVTILAVAQFIAAAFVDRAVGALVHRRQRAQPGHGAQQPAGDDRRRDANPAKHGAGVSNQDGLHAIQEPLQQ